MRELGIDMATREEVGGELPGTGRRSRVEEVGPVGRGVRRRCWRAPGGWRRGRWKAEG